VAAADIDKSEGADHLFADAACRIAAGQMEVAPLIHDATRLQELGLPVQSAELYKCWIAFNADHPVLHAVLSPPEVPQQIGNLSQAPSAEIADYLDLPLVPSVSCVPPC